MSSTEKIEKKNKIDKTCYICQDEIIYFDDGVIICDEYFRDEQLYGGFDNISEYQEIDWVCLKCFDNNAEIIIQESIKEYDFETSTYKPNIKINTFKKCICGKGIRQLCIGNGCSSRARVCLGCKTKKDYTLKWCKECDIFSDDNYLSDGN